METKELKIQIPEGYCIDESKSTFEKIVFKKKDAKPRSWGEYCDNFKGRFYFIKDDDNSPIVERYSSMGLNSRFKNTLPSKELAEAFIAMMQLISLRQEWVGDWESDWSIPTEKYAIQYNENKVCLDVWHTVSRPLSFPTQEMAKDFLNCFKDLIEKARILL